MDAVGMCPALGGHPPQGTTEGLGNLAVQAPKLVIAEDSTNACIGCRNGQARLLS
jgi:hypothetical protein